MKTSAFPKMSVILTLTIVVDRYVPRLKTIRTDLREMNKYNDLIF